MSVDKVGKSSREPGRPPKRLEPADGPLPALAQALRDLREACGNPKYRSLATYAGVPHQRLAEAARGEHLPAWTVVEGYVNGCQSYYQHKHRSPPAVEGIGDPVRWRQLYQQAGGVLLEPEPEQCSDTAAGLPARLAPGSRLKRRFILAGAATVGVALLTGGGVMIGMSLSGKSFPAAGSTSRPGTWIVRTAGTFVTPPAPACGNAAADGFRSPATTAFSPVKTIDTVSLDGLSVSTMHGLYRGISYYWVEAHPSGRRAGMQLRWSSSPDKWHYCTATLESGNISALPDLVLTMAVPAIVHGRQVLYQTCVWHQHPYSAQCSQVH